MNTLDPALLQSATQALRTQDDPQQQAAAEVFARLLVSEITRSLPNGGLLGDGATSVLSTLATDALASVLVQGDTLGIQAMFGEAPRPAPKPAPDLTPVRKGTVSSTFGMRLDPFTGAPRHHDGIDIAAPEGTPIHATRDGTVRSVKTEPGYGHLVILDHGGGRETRYAHCAEVVVTPGQVVSRGDKIATVGQSGRATGPHLHFEVRQDGQPIDPEVPGSHD